MPPQGSFQSYMRAASEHSENVYQHNRHLMSRMTAGMVKRAESEIHFKAYSDQYRKEAAIAAERARKRKLADKVPTLPTIADASEDVPSPEKEAEPEEELRRKRSSTIEPIVEDDDQEEEEKRAAEDEDKPEKMAAFRIGNLDEDSDGEGYKGGTASTKRGTRSRLYSGSSVSKSSRLPALWL